MFSHIKELFTRPSGYTIARSVRLRSSASAYFSRTNAANGSQQKFTWSGWVKRGSLTTGADLWLFCSDNYTTGTNKAIQEIVFRLSGDPSADQLRVNIEYTVSGTSSIVSTNAVYRDIAAWYHIVVAVDTTQATASNRMLMYVNGQQVTSFATASYIAQNTNININQSGQTPTIGCMNLNGSPTRFFDGYLTEINFIDGQALTPSSFGETDSITGVWKAKKYSGTYGTNGFYLNFSDNSSNTATTIGKDYSGNGNNWTPNNISVTSGVTYDSMVDSPTTSAVSSNYAVLNPLDKSTRITLSNGNLTTAFDQTVNHAIVRASIGMTTGKFYWEVTVSGQTGSAGAPVDIFGIQSAGSTADGVYVGSTGTGMGWGYNTTNVNFYASNFTTSGTPPVQINGTMSVAYDADNGLIWFASAGTYIQGNPSTGSSPSGTRTGTNVPMFPAVSFNNTTTGTWNFNFGQQPFVYTPPTGFVALNTQNLPDSTIKNGAAYMAATTYTGTGASQTIANTVNSISFQPDFVWMKGRSGATDHALYDSVRGTTIDLVSNSTAAETTQSTGLTAFGSTGFTIGALAKVNTNASTYVGWQWKAGGSSSSNTNGSITSTVSVGATQGFSVVTFTAQTSGTGTVGHGLGVAPSMIITKVRNNTSNWASYHVSLGNTQYIELNTTTAAQTLSTAWNNTSPTSTVFTLGSAFAAASQTMVAYCFAAVAGYSAFGSYTGNGSADGPFVYTGFRPRLIMIKDATNSATQWTILDSSRNPSNITNARLMANLANSENAEDFVDLLSNGFKVRPAFSSTINTSGANLIYMAFAENPFKNSLAR